jgi:hypothetical protein
LVDPHGSDHWCLGGIPTGFLQDVLVPQGQDKFGGNSSTMSLKSEVSLQVRSSVYHVSYRGIVMVMFLFFRCMIEVYT